MAVVRRGHVDMTPIDIQQYQFRKSVWGFDVQEVRRFLDTLAQQLAERMRETNTLKTELKRTECALQEHRDRETSLREAMLTAQRAIDEIREQAQKEAEVMVAEAELRAEKLLHTAQKRVTKVLEDVADLKRQKVRALEELRGVLRTHERLLEMHDAEAGGEPSGEVMVLDRLRAPLPPSQDDLQGAGGG